MSSIKVLLPKMKGKAFRNKLILLIWTLVANLVISSSFDILFFVSRSN